MIARLIGKTFVESDGVVILDVNGVCYELLCSQNTIMDFEVQKEKTTAYVYTYIREDLMQLFGFSTRAEKQLFLNLVSVNGVGPKMAIGILSGCQKEQLLQAIDNEDVKFLSKLPKIGKKKAEQIILTLRGKLVIEETVGVGISASSNKKDIISALTHLGFQLNDVETVVSQMPVDIEVQQGVRDGLSQLGAQF